MGGRIVFVFVVAMLITTSCFVTGIELKASGEETSIEKDNLQGNIAPLGIGGWHNKQTITKDGQDTSNLEKIGGDGGGWEKPFDGSGVRIWAELNRVMASYDFDISEGPVKYVEYGIRFKDVGLLSDSPDAKIYKWNDEWDVKSNIAGGHQGSYVWKYHTFDTNTEFYVNNDGIIRIAAQAYDDDNYFHQDNIAINKIQVAYQAADEEIYVTEISKYDSDEDGASDAVELSIDADVADNGDGTTVEVTAICELLDPYGNLTDSTEITWTIIDHQSDTGVAHLSSLGGINGEYTVNIKLYDAYGNLEDNYSEEAYLVPDPQRNILFLCAPDVGGYINISGEIYIDNMTGTTSDGTFTVNATPMDYYIFSHWEYDGGIYIAPENINDPETEVIISDNGTLKANFIYTLKTLYFYVIPDYAGIIIISGYEFENGTDVLAEEGTYDLEAAPILDNYYFYAWEAYGDIVIENLYDDSTTITVNGDGAIVAYFVENDPPEQPNTPQGPITGATQTTYTYTTSTTDYDGNELYYMFDWGDGTDSGWIGPYESDEPVSASHKWAGSRVYEVRVKAKDIFNAESPWSPSLPVGIYSPPNPPVINGPTSGKIGTELTFTIYATDPDEEDVYFYIDWGDGDFENWIGPYNSGETVTVTHTWTKKDTFTIRAQSKDENDVVSDTWGTFVVSMPKEKIFERPFLQFFIQKLDQYPLFEKIISLFIR